MIREINIELSQHGGTNKKKLGRLLFPFYKLAQDASYISDEFLNILGYIYSSSKEKIDRDIKQDEYIYTSSEKNSDKYLTRYRLILNSAAIFLAIIVISTGLSPIMKVITSFFSILLLGINIMPWIFRVLSEEQE